MESRLMTIYDLSVPLTNEMPTYPGDPGIQISNWSSLSKGDAANVSLLNFGAHTGTHIDAPAHFIAGGNKLESLPLEVLIGRAEVIEVPREMNVIEEAFVAEHCRPAITRFLFRTKNSDFWNDLSAPFRTDFTYLAPQAAARLVSQGARLVGIDYLSVEQFKSKRHETHLTLLSGSVIIVEGLDLRNVPVGVYELICLPLRILSEHGDGSPARAILRDWTAL